MDNLCPKCNGRQYSELDKNYLKLFPHCWECDRNRWEEGKISLIDFEERERIALSETMN